MRNRIKPLALAVAIPVLVGGWALFRPELLLVQSHVDEKAPVSSTAASSPSLQGDFVSFAHETTGIAKILQEGGKRYLRLENFHTSNGPDVRVYLVKGTNSGEIGAGFHDLGTIKGTSGDQNYEIPSDLDLSEYGAVAIWCKRFSVGFGGATLERTPEQTQALAEPTWQLASFADQIRVTSGNLRGKVSGAAEIVERDGKRNLVIRNAKFSGMPRILLVKIETIQSAADVKRSEKIDLGLLKSSNQSFSVPKDIDLWLYRSVSVWDAKKNVQLGTAELRSDQERPKTLA